MFFVLIRSESLTFIKSVWRQSGVLRISDKNVIASFGSSLSKIDRGCAH